MKIIASVAISSDGYMDDCSPQRLVLSDTHDWAEVYVLRAECDAILVGAETARRDNPSLMLRDERLRRKRVLEGKSADIIKVVISGNCDLSPTLRFFKEGDSVPKIVITREDAPAKNIFALLPFATIILLPEITAHAIVDSLHKEGVETLLVEGGAQIIKMFIDEGMLDRMRLAVSPVTVGEPKAPRLPYFGMLPFDNHEKINIRKVGIMTVYDYEIQRGLTFEDRKYLKKAIDISRRSQPCPTAYRVGCVIKTLSGKIFEGYTHETNSSNHAEEEAIVKAVAAGENLYGATVYSSMEPCSTRNSKPISCSALLIKYGFSKVVYAYAEPDCFVRCEGAKIIRKAGIEVIEAPEYSGDVMQLNSHIIKT